LTASDFNKFRGHVEVENYGLAWCDSINEIQMGEWNHVAQTFDGNTLKVYVNGKEECSAAGVGKIKTTSEPVRIGNNNPDTSNFDFIGKIDEVGIHNYALSPSEIKESYEKHGTTVHDVIEMASETTAGTAQVTKELKNILPYKLQSGDYLEYDLYWKHSNAQIAFDFKTDFGGNKAQFKNSNVKDQNNINSHPNTNIADSYVLNKWYHRVIPVPDILIGTTIQQYKIQSGSDDIGIHTGYLDNIAITDGQGSIRKMIFNHGLNPFKQVFAYGQVASIKITPEPKFESGPDTTAPLILIPGNIVVDATSKDGAVVDYSAKAIDDVDEVVTVTCTPKSGSMFSLGDRTVMCSAIDSSSNEGVNSFIVSVETINAVPDWVKEVALFYSNDEIEYASFTNALEYLINNDIIRIDTSETVP